MQRKKERKKANHLITLGEQEEINYELVGMWKKVIIAYFKVPSLYMFKGKKS